MGRVEILQEIFNGSWVADAGIPRDLDQYNVSYEAIVNFVKENQINVGLFVVFVVMAIRQIVSKNKEASQKGVDKKYLDAPDFPEIESLGNFDWKKEDPLKLRLFKPKYHLTMGKSSRLWHASFQRACCDISKWLLHGYSCARLGKDIGTQLWCVA